jgi:hypothetical protein
MNLGQKTCIEAESSAKAKDFLTENAIASASR